MLNKMKSLNDKIREEETPKLKVAKKKEEKKSNKPKKK